MSGLLDKLDRAKQTRPGEWVAACPCCQSKRGRPLSVRVLDDGRTLLHPFCGCDTSEVLRKLGLSMADLFPQRLGDYFAPTKAKVSARAILECLSEETTVVAVLASDWLKRQTLSGDDWQRLAVAAHRINSARDYSNG